MILQNAHVIRYYLFKCHLAEFYRRPMAQWYWYTQLMLEENPHWTAEQFFSINQTNPAAPAPAHPPVAL